MLVVDFGYSPWFVFICFLVSGGLTYWMYKTTIVQVSNRLKLILGTFRFISIFIILLLFLEPFVTSKQEVKNQPIIALLLDDSESILANKDSAFIRSELPNKLNQIQQEFEKNNIALHTYTFGRDLNKIELVDSSLNYRQTETNLSNALTKTEELYANQNLCGILCLSDGIMTTGQNPINITDELSVPIFTSLLGDTSTTKDILIESVLYNDISYKGMITPIMVNLKSIAFETRTVQVTLSSRGKVFGSQNVVIQKNNTAKVEFSVNMEIAGIQQFEIHVTELENEITHQNNHAYIFIKVLDKQKNILLVSSGPHPDIGALKKVFSRNKEAKFSTLIRKNETEFYEAGNQFVFSNYDLILLHNFPSSVNDREILQKIYDEVNKRKVPLIHFVGSDTRFNIHPDQIKYMALKPERLSNTMSNVFINVQPSYKSHSSFRVDDEKLFYKWLNTAPPLLRRDTEWSARPNSQVLASTKIKGIVLDYPLFAIQEVGDFKNMVFTAENIWRYRMHAYTEEGSFDLFDDWIQNMVQWLTAKKDNRRFKVYPIKSLFQSDEKIIFKGQVLDDANIPIKDAEMKLSIVDQEGVKTDYFLNEPQPTNYSLELNNFEQGTYSYQAQGLKNGKLLGTDGGQFSVGKSAIEFSNLQANEQLMRQLALRTKGEFSFSRQIGQLSSKILNHPEVKPIIEIKKKTQSLNQWIIPILIVLLLLSIEWIIRKRYSLI